MKRGTLWALAGLWLAMLLLSLCLGRYEIAPGEVLRLLFTGRSLFYKN